MDAVGTAQLTSDILAQRAVGARVSRRQITDVLHEPDGAPELVLDFVAAEAGEHATISMTWSRDDLERLLETDSGDEVEWVFDRDQLAGAFGDVEGCDPSAGAGANVDPTSPRFPGLNENLHGLGDPRQRSLHGVGNLAVLRVHETQNLLRAHLV